LFWVMVIGGSVIWLAVMALAVYAAYLRPGAHRPDIQRWLIVGGGAVFPTLVLAALLGYGLYLMPQLRQPVPSGELKIAVAGAQWWWRMTYQRPGQPPVELANELRLPVGVKVELSLSSPDVIHSFWVPPLGGKLDMVPGRVNRLVLEPSKPGIYRGVCAEYCGASHALMAFPTVVMEPAEFDAWLTHQAAPAQPPTEPLARRGQALFLANGCGGCHSIRGTEADGTIGPELTHVGSRLSLAAGVLPNEVDAFVRWIAHTQEVKPGVLMPPFPMLPEQDLRAIAVYLESLQ
jgi:cytochrome c oxidase subunit 2